MHDLHVVTNKFQVYMIVILAIIFVPLIIGLLAMSLMGGLEPVPLFLGLLLLSTFFGVIWLYRRGHSRSIRVFSTHGLTRNDGQELAWSGLRRVVYKMAIKPGSEKKRLWRTEIQFMDGSTAWIIPSKVSNYDEVKDYVGGLPCEHVQEDA